MQRSVSAALLSALVFPGAGQLYLGRRGRACLFLLPTLLAVAYFVSDVAARSSAMVDQMLAGSAPLDPVAIAAQLERQGGDSPWITASIVVMLMCWLGSIVDAYVIARAGRSLRG